MFSQTYKLSNFFSSAEIVYRRPSNLTLNFFFSLKAQLELGSRFRNFSLYLSNTIRKEDGLVCFHESNEVGFNNLELTTRCEGIGRFVIYYNNRETKSFGDGLSREAYIELCEVQVIGECVFLILQFNS